MKDQREDELVRAITRDPDIFEGKPLVRGRRLAVEHVLGMLAAGTPVETIVEGYPWLDEEDVQACFAYARRTLGREREEVLGEERDLKLLLDTCVWGGARDELAEAGHDVVWGGDWPAQPNDADLLERAREEQRTVVTLDPDFGERARLMQVDHFGILRMVNVPAPKQARVCLKILAKYRHELQDGAVMVTDGRRLKVKRPALDLENATQDL